MRGMLSPRRGAVPPAAAATLRADGRVVVPGVLPAAEMGYARVAVEAAAEVALRGVAAGADFGALFMQVRAQHERCNVRLPLCAGVRAAVQPVLYALSPLLASVLDPAEEESPLLVELAAIIADPGAPRQALHTDTPPCGGDPQMLTVFIALQDTPAEMGPTWVIPGSHTPEADAALCTAQRVAAAGGVPPRPGHEHRREERAEEVVFRSRAEPAALLAGDCMVMDSRLWHCGGANTAPRGSGRRRVYLVVSFRSVWREEVTLGARMSGGTMGHACDACGAGTGAVRHYADGAPVQRAGGARIHRGIMHRCDECDYDACARCFEKGGAACGGGHELTAVRVGKADAEWTLLADYVGRLRLSGVHQWTAADPCSALSQLSPRRSSAGAAASAGPRAARVGRLPLPPALPAAAAAREVRFVDGDGDELVFTARGGAVVYSINGDERPPSRELLWTVDSAGSYGKYSWRFDTGGRDVPGCVVMLDIGKWLPLPRDGLAETLAGLRRLAGAAGARCSIGDVVDVRLPEGDVLRTEYLPSPHFDRAGQGMDAD